MTRPSLRHRPVGLAAALLFAAIVAWLRPLDPPITALQFATTPQAVQAVRQAWGDEGIARFRAHLPADGLLLMLYGSFGVLAVRQRPAFGALPLRQRRKALVALPLAALADAGENLAHAVLTDPSLAAPPWLPTAAAVCATVKFAGLAAFAVLWAWAHWRWRRAAGKAL